MEKVYLRKVFGVLCLALLVVAGAAIAETPQNTEAETAPAETETLLVDPAAAPGPGMRAVLDPETGELRVPTVEEAREMFGEDDEGYRALIEPSNFWVEETGTETLILHVDPEFFKHAIVTLDENGQPVVEHHPAHDAAEIAAEEHPAHEAVETAVEEKDEVER